MPFTDSGTRILNGLLQEKTRTDIAQEPFCGNLQQKILDPPANTSIEHRVLTVTVTTPQCGHTVWGNVYKNFSA